MKQSEITSFVPMRYRCLRCGWEWIPRTNNVPKNCPSISCRSPKWQIPRLTKKQIHEVRVKAAKKVKR